MNQIKNILAAVGQFPQDNQALARAVEIARAHEASLTIVHVIEGFSGLGVASTEFLDIRNQVLLNARENIKTAIARKVVGIAEVDVRIEIGSSSLTLIELIDEITPDLVVMRAHQHESILKKIIGSTTDRVIRTSRVPVLIVKREVSQEYQRVVVSIETPDSSAAVVHFVDTLLPSTELSLVHIVQIPHQFETAMIHANSGHDIAAHRDALMSEAKASLQAMSKKLEHRPKASSTRVVAGDPAKSLVRATWSAKVDLIVLGPGSTSMLRHALLGSVTQRVLHGSTCDVLICHTTSQHA